MTTRITTFLVGDSGIPLITLHLSTVTGRGASQSISIKCMWHDVPACTYDKLANCHKPGQSTVGDSDPSNVLIRNIISICTSTYRQRPFHFHGPWYMRMTNDNRVLPRNGIMWLNLRLTFFIGQHPEEILIANSSKLQVTN